MTRRFLCLLRKACACCEPACALVLAWACLRWMPLRRLSLRSSVLLRRTRRPPPLSLAEAQRIADRIARIGGASPRLVCLPQALATQWLLARRGATCVLHVGIARDGTRTFRSHAWATFQGQVILGGTTAPGCHQEIFRAPALPKDTP